MTYLLRYYQTDVIERARQRFRDGARRLIIQGATGSGKTVTASEIIRAAVARGKRALFIAHRRRLVAQIAATLDGFGVSYGVVMRDDDRFRPGAMVQVASRDTLLSRCVRNEWVGLPRADLVIADECHNTASDGYMRILSAYPDAHVVGLTATPARSDGRGLGDYYQALECTVPTSRLIREGFLVPVRCYAPERRKGRSAGLVGDPVFNWKRYAEGRPTVLFTSKVATSLAAAAAFNGAGVAAEHMDAHTPDAEREAIIDRVKSGRTKVVTNAAVLTEGVDVPELSCCILLRMAGSYVLFAQAIGRIMRPCPGKADAVLIDHAGACLKHGMPDQDVEWELKESETVDERNKKAREEGKRDKPLCCPRCFFLFTGSLNCPACGQMLPRRMLPAETRHELLVEVLHSLTPEERHEREVRDWQRCLAIMGRKGRTLGAAAAMWRRDHGRWPDDMPSPSAPHLARLPVLDVYPDCIRGRGA